jgi:hypothetical protein
LIAFMGRIGFDTGFDTPSLTAQSVLPEVGDVAKWSITAAFILNAWASPRSGRRR